MYIFEINPLSVALFAIIYAFKVLVAQSCLTLATRWTVGCQASLSMEFSRQEDWSGLPSYSPGDFLYLGIDPKSPVLWADSSPSELPRKT